MDPAMGSCRWGFRRFKVGMHCRLKITSQKLLDHIHAGLHILVDATYHPLHGPTCIPYLKGLKCWFHPFQNRYHGQSMHLSTCFWPEPP